MMQTEVKRWEEEKKCKTMYKMSNKNTLLTYNDSLNSLLKLFLPLIENFREQFCISTWSSLFVSAEWLACFDISWKGP